MKTKITEDKTKAEKIQEAISWSKTLTADLKRYSETDKTLHAKTAFIMLSQWLIELGIIEKKGGRI